MGTICGLILGVIAGYAIGIGISERTIRELKSVIRKEKDNDDR